MKEGTDPSKYLLLVLAVVIVRYRIIIYLKISKECIVFQMLSFNWLGNQNKMNNLMLLIEHLSGCYALK